MVSDSVKRWMLASLKANTVLAQAIGGAGSIKSASGELPVSTGVYLAVTDDQRRGESHRFVSASVYIVAESEGSAHRIAELISQTLAFVPGKSSAPGLPISTYGMRSLRLARNQTYSPPDRIEDSALYAARMDYEIIAAATS